MKTIQIRKMTIGILVGMMVSFVSGAALGAHVHDWKDLDRIHKHLQETLREMEKARKANHYDMDGHGAKCEELVKQAEQEEAQAVASAKKF